MIEPPRNPILSTANYIQQEEETFNPTDKAVKSEQNLLTQQAFNKASLSAVYRIVALLNEKRIIQLSDVDLLESICTEVATLRQDLAAQAGKPNYWEYGLQRSACTNRLFFKTFTPNSTCRSTTKAVFERLGLFSLDVDHDVCSYDNLKVTTDIYHPETIVTRKAKATDPVDLHIFQLCSFLVSESPAKETEYCTANPVLIDIPTLSKHHFFVQKLYYHKVGESTFPLSTYVAVLEQGPEGLKLTKKAAVLRPKIEANSKLKVGTILREILNWNKQDSTQLNHLMIDFAYFFSHFAMQCHGTNWGLQVISKALYKDHGFKLIKYQDDIRIGLQPLASQVLSRFRNSYLNFFQESPTQLADATQMASRYYGSEKFKLTPLDVLERKLKMVLELRTQYHADTRQELLPLASSMRKQTQKIKSRNFPEKFNNVKVDCAIDVEKDKQGFRVRLFQQEMLFHTKQLDFYKKMSEALLTDPSTFLKLLEDSLQSLEEFPKQLKLSLVTDYLFRDKTQFFNLSLSTHYGYQPTFVDMKDNSHIFENIKQYYAENNIQLPVDNLTMQVIVEDLNKLSPDVIPKLRAKIREKYIAESDYAILVERYISPGQETSYVRHPSIIQIGKSLFLVNVFTNSYPQYFSMLQGYHKGFDRFLAMLEGERKALFTLRSMFSAFRKKVDEQPIRPQSTVLTTGKITHEENVIRLAKLQEASAGGTPSKKKTKKKGQSRVEAPIPPVLSQPEVSAAPLPPIITSDPEVYEIFCTLMKKNKRSVSWGEICRCLSSLGFTIKLTSKGLVKFKYQKEVFLLQDEGPTAAYDGLASAVRSTGAPKRTDKALSDDKIDILKKLLLKAGFHENRVVLRN